MNSYQWNCKATCPSACHQPPLLCSPASAGKVTIGCNNQGVLHHVCSPPTYIPCTVKHVDLVQTILTAQCLCPIQLNFQYVAGHQDMLMCFEELPPLAQLNVQADHMAKQALYLLGNKNTPLLSTLPGINWSLVIQGNLILSEPHLEILQPPECTNPNSLLDFQGTTYCLLSKAG